MSVQLQQLPIGTTLTASDHFGHMKGLLVGVPVNTYIKPWITIPAGFYALVTSNGAMINDPKTGSPVWSPGIHRALPWVNVSHLVPMSHMVFDTPCKGCKSKDNVTVRIDVACVFRIMGDAARGEDPALVPKFVHEMTPRGLQQQLADAMDEAVRVLARSMKHREVYGLRSLSMKADGTPEISKSASAHSGQKDAKFTAPKGASSAGAAPKGVKTVGYNPKAVAPEVGIEMADTAGRDAAGDGDLEAVDEGDAESMLLVGAADASDAAFKDKARSKGESATGRVVAMLNRQFMPQGVQITDVMITNVELPADIVSQMSNKTMVISNNAQEIMQQQFQMQELRFAEEIKKMHQSYDEERRQEQQDAVYHCSEARVKLENLRAEASKKVAMLKQESAVAVKSVRANADLTVTKLNQEANKIESELRTKSAAQAAEIAADSELYCEQKLSEARLEVERNNAKAVSVLGDAEGTVAPLLKTFHEYEFNQEKLRVFENLAANRSLIVTPADNEDLETMCIVDHIMADHGQGSGGSRSQMLSELMLMRGGGQVAVNQNTGTAVLATASK